MHNLEARGNGKIDIFLGLSGDRMNRITVALNKAGFETSVTSPGTVNFWIQGEHFPEDVEEALSVPAEMRREGSDLPAIYRGVLEYVGEDGSLWRYVFKDDAWVKETGHVEYSKPGSEPLMNDKLKEALKGTIEYILGDCEVMMGKSEAVAQALSVLYEVCLLTDSEIEEIGLGYLLNE